MAFKHGRLGELWLNAVDVSNYFASASFNAKQAAGDVTTFKVVGVPSTYHAFIAGLAEATLTASGYYDSSEADKVRATLQAVVGQLTYMPAGAVAIGDMARLLNINSTDYKTGSNVGKAVTLDWTAQGTAPIGFGNVLAPLTVYGVGAGVATTGEPTGLGNGGVQTTTGLVAHLHVTAMTGGDTHTFKLQDATTVGGTYADITGGAFVNVTAIGSQRLVIPSVAAGGPTIRQFVRLMYTVAGHSATFAVAAART